MLNLTRLGTLVAMLGFMTAAAIEGQVCTPAGDDVLHEIDAILEEHAEAHYARDAAGAVAMYADRIWWGDHEGSWFVSLDEQQAGYQSMYEQGGISFIEYETTAALQCGNSVFAEGGYRITFGGTGVEETWAMSNLWIREDLGVLKLHGGLLRLMSREGEGP